MNMTQFSMRWMITAVLMKLVHGISGKNSGRGV